MSENENQFEELRRLLRLKQHEVPPPGYFNRFSGEVISRIRAGEAGGEQGFTERLQNRAPWLANFLQVFETRPGVIGAMATVLCLLLVLGAVINDRSDSVPAKNLLAVSTDNTPAGDAGLGTAAEPSLAVSTEPAGGIMVATNPVSLQPLPAYFGQQDPLFQVQNVSLTGTGN